MLANHHFQWENPLEIASFTIFHIYGSHNQGVHRGTRVHPLSEMAGPGTGRLDADGRRRLQQQGGFAEGVAGAERGGTSVITWKTGR